MPGSVAGRRSYCPGYRARAQSASLESSQQDGGCLPAWPIPKSNTIGLLRQYLPKGTDLSVYSQEELDAIADSLDSRPRATQQFHSLFEVFANMLALASRPDTSVH